MLSEYLETGLLVSVCSFYSPTFPCDAWHCLIVQNSSDGNGQVCLVCSLQKMHSICIVIAVRFYFEGLV